MSSDTELEVRDIRAGYIAWCRGELPRDMVGEKFDRFIAKVKADALREAAYEFAEGAWSDEFLGDRVENDVEAVQCMYRWFERRSDRIERHQEDT